MKTSVTDRRSYTNNLTSFHNCLSCEYHCDDQSCLHIDVKRVHVLLPVVHISLFRSILHITGGVLSLSGWRKFEDFQGYVYMYLI